MPKTPNTAMLASDKLHKGCIDVELVVMNEIYIAVLFNINCKLIAGSLEAAYSLNWGAREI